MNKRKLLWLFQLGEPLRHSRALKSHGQDLPVPPSIAMTVLAEKCTGHGEANRRLLILPYPIGFVYLGIYDLRGHTPWVWILTLCMHHTLGSFVDSSAKERNLPSCTRKINLPIPANYLKTSNTSLKGKKKIRSNSLVAKGLALQVPESHVGADLCPGCSFSHLAPSLWPRKAVRNGPKPWDHAFARETQKRFLAPDFESA